MTIRIEPRWPHYIPEYSDYSPEFDSLAGATIVRIGTSPDLRLDGGGLVIEFRRKGDGDRSHILALEFGDTGLGKADISKCINEKEHGTNG